ncbi:restriction endonuclease subunit S [Streptomyces flavofungini]|uniref:restriction endonuclease subunit S n=1 Tax=Streptomyces flavofungini TaxID=68200 RepID=UPI0025B26B1C|nr:restriction endonuclease subunit S [Streptomyces flavofungini]WJV47674.1 restriction endonuclease subunit S [Streptomyces flavofungini]
MSDAELPKGWVWATLGDIASWGSGGTPKSGVTQFYGGDIPWVVSGDLNDEPIYSTTSTITTEGLDSSSAKWVPEGSVLIAMYGATIGKLAVTGRPLTTNQAVAFATPHKALIDKRFMFWYLRSQRDVLRKAGKGGAQPNISQTILKAWPIPVPPLAEQHRIVEAIEGHISRLDVAQSSLTVSARRSAKLLQRLASVAVAIDATTAHTTTLGAVASVVKNGIFISRPGSEPIGVPILRIGAVRPLRLDTTDIRYTGLQDNSEELSGSLLNAGDLLFTRYNGNPEYVGACAVVPDATGSLTYPDKLIRVVVDRQVVLPEYAALACSAGAARQYIRQRVKTTAGQAGISGRELKSVPLVLPSVEEQQRRVRQYQAAAEAIGMLQGGIERASIRSLHLRNALLHRAFSGQLVPQDPADEPASVPLGRIRTKREAQDDKPKRAVRRPRKTVTADAPPPPPASTTSSSPANAVQQELPL